VRRRAAFAVVLACGCLSPAWAAMYKWVDEKGVTQYSETPPPGAKATRIEIAPSPPAAAPKDDWKQRELESRQRRLQKDAEEQQDQARAAQRRQRCLAAQREIDVLRSGRPVYQVNERGERVYLGDKERAREIEGWQGRAQAYCD
jgi:Domain of unknown function (DUF4124)